MAQGAGLCHLSSFGERVSAGHGAERKISGWGMVLLEAKGERPWKLVALQSVPSGEQGGGEVWVQTCARGEAVKVDCPPACVLWGSVGPQGPGTRNQLPPAEARERRQLSPGGIKGEGSVGWGGTDVGSSW